MEMPAYLKPRLLVKVLSGIGRTRIAIKRRARRGTLTELDSSLIKKLKEIKGDKNL